jgi:hypothetical protein
LELWGEENTLKRQVPSKSGFLVTVTRIVPYGAGTIKWYFDIMIANILNAPWWVWFLGIIIFLYGFRLLVNWYIKKGDKEDARKKEADAKKEAERQLTLGPSDFYNFCDLFINEKNKDLVIRILNFYDHKTADKDKFVFASSLPYHFKKEDEVHLILAIPQIVNISVYSHKIIIEKSAAVSLDYELKEKILTHLFLHLSKIYTYMIECQPVLISEDRNNKDCLCIYLRTPLKYHLWLRERLLSLEEVSSIDDFNSDDIYNFAIWKDPKESWEDTLPFIKGVIADYFKAGVEFSGFKTQN